VGPSTGYFRRARPQRIDVIVTVDVLFVRAAKHATSTIPIVSAGNTGLVEHGLVASLSRPGGNITGLEDQMTPDLGAKTVQLFGEALPGARRFAMLAGPRWASWVGEVRRLVEPTGVRLVAIGDETEGGLRAAFRTLRRGRPDGLIIVILPLALFISPIAAGLPTLQQTIGFH